MHSQYLLILSMLFASSSFICLVVADNEGEKEGSGRRGGKVGSMMGEKRDGK